jgi:hypothetical protein
MYEILPGRRNPGNDGPLLITHAGRSGSTATDTVVTANRLTTE